MTMPHKGPLPPHTGPHPDHYGPSAAYAPYPQWAPGCQVCGARPAVDVTIRGHQGLLIVMRFAKYRGTYCRTCATAVMRATTTKTLALGWWSPLSLILFTPFTLLWNAVMHARVRRLSPPTDRTLGAPVLDEGKPIAARPLAYVTLIPAAWLVWMICNIVLDATG